MKRPKDESISTSKKNTIFAFQRISNGSTNDIVGRIQFDPLDYEANKALVYFLLKTSGVPKNRFSIERG